MPRNARRVELDEVPVSPRFTLLLILMFLFGGGLVLLLKPAAPQPTPTAIAIADAPSPASDAAAPPKSAAATPKTKGKRFLILAASWEPAFCEGARDKPECQSMGNKRFDATNFSLHGLWPEQSYCGVSQTLIDLDKAGRWAQLPPVELDNATRAALDQVMPGTRSQLERHEWTKHGTCTGMSAAQYFGTSILLLSALNGSNVRDLFAGNIGRQLTTEQVRASFDASFGAGAGDRVKLACDPDDRRTLISELTLGLWGDPGDTPNLGELLLAARPTSPGCAVGLIDASGMQ
jgi:ribonuclease T2